MELSSILSRLITVIWKPTFVALPEICVDIILQMTIYVLFVRTNILLTCWHADNTTV